MRARGLMGPMCSRCRAGVDGVDVVIGTSSFLREFSHGKDMAYITKPAIEVINFVKSKGQYPPGLCNLCWFL